MSDAIGALRMRTMPSLESSMRPEQLGGRLPLPGASEIAGSDLAQVGTESFGELFSNFVSGVNEQHHASADAQAAMMRGEDIEIHDVMIQMEQASVSTDLLLEMRNRLVAAVNELTRMPM